jgi:hypothetical protein
MSRPSGRPSNSATNSDPGTFVFAEPLFLIPFGSLPTTQEVTSAASRNLFRRNQFSSCPRGGRLSTAAARRLGPQSRCKFSRRNHFSSFSSGLDWRRGKPGGHACGVGALFSGRNRFSSFPLVKISRSVMASDRAPREQFALLSAEPLFLIRFNSRRPLAALLFR